MPTGISGLYKNTKGAKIARGEKIKQTNFDRIKAMSVDEMAEFLAHISTDCEKFCVFVDENGDCIGCGGQCVDGIKQYLESVVQEDE